jgi:hypothetical protein
MIDSIIDFGSGLLDTLTSPRTVMPNVTPSMPSTGLSAAGTPTAQANAYPTIQSVSTGQYDPFTQGTSAQSMPQVMGPSLLESLLGAGGSAMQIYGGLQSLEVANEAVDALKSRQAMSEDAYRRYLAEQEKRQSLNF